METIYKKETLKIRKAILEKLKSEGKAQKMRMSVKEDKQEYSDKMVNNVLYQRYGKDMLSCYTYDELMTIYTTISKSLVKIRSGCTDAEVITLLQVVFLTICGELRCKTSIDDVLVHKKMLREEA